MSFTRRATDKDATWARAWTADALADLVTIAATQEPKHGDIAFVTANGTYYLFMDNNTWYQLAIPAFSVNQTFMPPSMEDDDRVESLVIPGPKGDPGPSGLTGPPGFEYQPEDSVNEPSLPAMPTVLPVEMGGTGMNSAQQGDMIYSDATNSYKRMAKSTSATRYVANEGTNNGPSWEQVRLNNGVQGVLPTANGGTSVNIASAALPLGSGQIQFPATQNPSSDVNNLDDYEEGTWTPVLGGNGGTSGQTYSVQFGNYIKIGKMVFAGFNVALSAAGTITGNLEIQGLPFTIENVGNNFPQAMMGYWQSLAIGLVHLTGFGNANSTFISIYGATAAATSLSALTSANVNNTTQLIGCIIYKASQ